VQWQFAGRIRFIGIDVLRDSQADPVRPPPYCASHGHYTVAFIGEGEAGLCLQSTVMTGKGRGSISDGFSCPADVRTADFSASFASFRGSECLF
jgi:hypothetical protein